METSEASLRGTCDSKACPTDEAVDIALGSGNQDDEAPRFCQVGVEGRLLDRPAWPADGELLTTGHTRSSLT